MSFVPATDPRVTKLVEALGLEATKVRRMTIDFQVDSIAVTVVEAYSSESDVEALTEFVREFKLIPKKLAHNKATRG